MKKDITPMGDLMTKREAVAYVNRICDRPLINENYLMRQCRRGNGPTYVMPSPRKVLFPKQALDQWMQAWVVR
jgi:hypothetical protein